jgi:hypothetical protein
MGEPRAGVRGKHKLILLLVLCVAGVVDHGSCKAEADSVHAWQSGGRQSWRWRDNDDGKDEMAGMATSGPAPCIAQEQRKQRSRKEREYVAMRATEAGARFSSVVTGAPGDATVNSGAFFMSAGCDTASTGDSLKHYHIRMIGFLLATTMSPIHFGYCTYNLLLLFLFIYHQLV